MRLQKDRIHSHNSMERRYLQARLPANMVAPVLAACRDAGGSLAQRVRFFCAQYAAQPSAVDHFSLEELLQTPHVWHMSTDTGARHRQWLQEAYPTSLATANDELKHSILKCGKCKQNTVDYHEMQTRGADEPMTVFAHCLTCGHRWTQ